MKGEQGLELHYNEENGKWEVRKEPFAVIECESEESYNKIKQLIERDKKKKPAIVQVENYAYPSYRCPDCDMFVSSLDNYCKECGQALDWKEG